MQIVYDMIKTFALPPGLILVVLMVGIVLIARGRRRRGLATVVSATVVLYVLSTPYISGLLLEAIQDQPRPEATLEHAGAEAIVVLSGGYLRFAPEFGGPTVDALTLQRLRYAAHLVRRLGLPVLVSGGTAVRAPASLASLMKAVLERDFGVAVRWTEERSGDTFENAAFSAALLKTDNVHHILLVTHAAHMRRAESLFADQGLRVTPAPTVFAAPLADGYPDLLPRLSGLQDSYYALYEMMGAAWYALRHTSAKTSPR